MNYRILVFLFLYSITSRVFAREYNTETPFPLELISYFTYPNELVPIRKVGSSTSTHTIYQHYFRGIPVMASLLHVWKTKTSQRFLTEGLKPAVNSDLQIDSTTDFILLYETQYFSVSAIRDGYGLSDSIKFTDQTGKILLSVCPRQYYDDPDTLLHAKVFMPNPIVTSGKKYGGYLSDENDGSNNILRSELYNRDVSVVRTTGALQWRTFKYGEVSDPNDGTHILQKDYFPIDRNYATFEAVNSLYHLQNFVRHLESIGYTHWIDSLQIDPHALYGADQSAFDGYNQPPSLEFGQGGVDDAEDGQVVIHEFFHALCFWVSPYTFIGTDRKSMEEASCDYMALSYTKQITGKTTSDIFSWDGHNEFWNGFSANTDETYLDWKSKISFDREIWSSTLYSIAQKIGWKKTDRLVLEHTFFLHENISPLEMCNIFLSLDSALFNAEDIQTLKQEFTRRFFMKPDSRDFKLESSEIKVCSGVDLHDRLTNQIIILSDPTLEIDVDLYDVSGNLIYQKNGKGELSIDVSRYASGFYLLSIHTKDNLGVERRLLKKFIK
ncbi:MAG: T9SS type A sorting domain-containing protein [Bacteroidetes bacterium]|nr:T9SS type A sorting domain-containing protein [Bacteroidota bacterium]